MDNDSSATAVGAESPAARDQRMAWWRHDRFGMFIHFGLFSLLGRECWVMNKEMIPIAEYEQLSGRFTIPHCDPREWAALAKAAGMRYMVLTTKHHDGFCLFDSRLTTYTSVHSAARRDIVGEYVEACRGAGLKVGLYFSLMDWHHPDGDERGLACPEAQQRFIAYVHGQVRELMTNYGRIDILWYDVSWPFEAEGWRSVELNAMVRRLQPHILINSRSRVPEDFGTPEQQITVPPKGRDWEACMTLNDSWGYQPGDHNWKDAREVVMLLATCAMNGGNLLLNVGPDGNGLVPPISASILREVGAWLERNGEAIYGTERLDCVGTDFGKVSRRGNTLYLIIDRWNGAELVLGRFHGTARSVRLIHPARPIAFRQEGHRLFMTGLPERIPDLPAAVIAIECDAPARITVNFSAANPATDFFDQELIHFDQ